MVTPLAEMVVRITLDILLGTRPGTQFTVVTVVPVQYVSVEWNSDHRTQGRLQGSGMCSVCAWNHWPRFHKPEKSQFPQV